MLSLSEESEPTMKKYLLKQWLAPCYFGIKHFDKWQFVVDFEQNYAD